jgi:2-amino-4-hydroxy-6-hydroxymethyldihydropteridine diphosphokinase
MISEIAFIGLGSNLGDRAHNLRQAVKRLAELPDTRVVAESRVIETAPVNAPAGSPPFLNAVVRVQTGLTPDQLLKGLLAIERDMGRDRAGQPRNAPRILDLDVLLYGDRVIDQPNLQVPHPRMHEREFVLRPLVELDANAKDPRDGSHWADALQRLRQAS